MRHTLNHIVILSGVWFLLLSVACAEEYQKTCLPCDDVQHASNLSFIEKRLILDRDNTFELLDEKEREWFATFQEGTLFFDGWQEISDDVVTNVPEIKKIKAQTTMIILGIKIGCEWSKDNSIRKISNSMLIDWGDELRQAAKKLPESLPLVINAIESEVDKLLIL